MAKGKKMSRGKKAGNRIVKRYVGGVSARTSVPRFRENLGHALGGGPADSRSKTVSGFRDFAHNKGKKTVAGAGRAQFDGMREAAGMAPVFGESSYFRKSGGKRTSTKKGKKSTVAKVADKVKVAVTPKSRKHKNTRTKAVTSKPKADKKNQRRKSKPAKGSVKTGTKRGSRDQIFNKAVMKENGRLLKGKKGLTKAQRKSIYAQAKKNVKARRN